MTEINPLHPEAAERQALAAMIAEPGFIAAMRDEVTAADWKDRQFAAIAAAIFKLGDATTAETIGSEIEKAGGLDLFGGQRAYAVAQAATIQSEFDYGGLEAALYHAREIKRYAMRRRTIEAAGRIAKTAYDLATDADDLPGIALQTMTDAIQVRDTAAKRPEDLAADFHARWALRHDKSGMTGTPTGNVDLDRLTDGFQPGQLITVTADTGGGKTVFMLQAAIAAALAGRPAVLISLEMTHAQLVDRIISFIGKKAAKEMTADEATAAANELPKLSRLTLIAPDDTGVTVGDVIAIAQRQKARHGNLGLVVIDYLGLIDHGQRGGDLLTTAIGRTTRILARAAKRLDCPILIGSQINRSGASMADGREPIPQLDHIFDSSRIAQDSDVVIMIGPPPEQTAVPPPDVPTISRTLYIRKNRAGSRAALPIVWKRDQFRMYPADLGQKRTA